MNKCKFHTKENINKRTERLDTSPLDLEVGLRVLLRDRTSKQWEIPGTVVSVRPGGRSAYIKLENNGKTYLRNCTLLRIDTATQSVDETCFKITCEVSPAGLHRSLRAPALYCQAVPGCAEPCYTRREKCRKK